MAPKRKISVEAGDRSASDLSVSLNDIRPLLELCSEVSHGDMFQAIDIAALADPQSHGFISLAEYFQILQELAVALHDETVRLSARHLMPGTTGFIISNMTSCNTLLDAMKLIAKTYNVLHGGAYNRVEEREGSLLYIVDDSHFRYMMENNNYIHFTMDCVLIFLHGMLSYISSDELFPLLQKVCVKRERNSLDSRHMGFWRAPTRYQSKTYALIYDISAALLPITMKPGVSPSSKDIYRQVNHMIEARKPSVEGEYGVADKVREAIEVGVGDQNEVARHLGFSVATLRRRLLEEGAGFRELRRQALNEMARAMLAQRVHAHEVAEELGFSDFRSFNRAFRRWNGVTPHEYAVKVVREGD